MTTKNKKIGIIGAGSWGTAISTLLIKAKPWNSVLLYTNEPTTMDSINSNAINPLFPDLTLSPNISATTNMNDMVECAEIFIAVPTNALRQVINQLIASCRKAKLNFKKDYSEIKLQHDTIREIPGLVLCCKGIEKPNSNITKNPRNTEQQSLMLPLEVVEDCGWKGVIAVLSGPNFASEVMQNLPTASTISTIYKSYGPILRLLLESPYFSLKIDTNTLSTQIYGALKNVIAIGSGLIEGLALGENAKASFFAASVAEISKVAIAAKAKIGSIISPAGIGDMFLTCSSNKSRNFAFGYQMGLSDSDEEIDFDQIIAEANQTTVEGYRTVQLIDSLEQRFKIKMPICRIISRIIKKELRPRNIVYCL